MRAFLSLASAAIFWASALGCRIPFPSPGPPPPPPPCYATMAVVVYDYWHGYPVDGVAVDREDTDGPDGDTNLDGYIAWEVPCGSYRVHLTRKGYHNQTASLRVDVNTQTDITMVRDQPLKALSRLTTRGIFFATEDGARWNWFGVTAFALAHQLTTGREAEAILFLDWAAVHDVTVVRVFLMAEHLFALSPERGVAVLPYLLELAAARGLYVEVVLLADTDSYFTASGARKGSLREADGLLVVRKFLSLEEYVRAAGQVLGQYPNALGEVANEPDHPTQIALVKDPIVLGHLRSFIPAHVLVSLGAAHGPQDESLAYAEGSDYVTVHVDRSEGEAGWRWVRHAREIQALRDAHHHKPAVSDEPDRKTPYADQHLALGLLARLYSFGDTVHLAGLRYGQVPTGDELDSFQAHRRAWTAMPAQWSGRYSRATLGGDPLVAIDDEEVLRAYSALTATEGYVLGLRVESETSLRWGNRWTPTLLVEMGKTRLWNVRRPAQ